ncbi:MAG: bile acid:sodium symporter family protein [Gammaproteobacteria bacterium]|nr:bile acid:sodium symporter family protein [Gammaproteobacteria bacterium]
MYILLRFIANGLAPLTLLGAILAYFIPETFTWIAPGFQWLFAATMFALGVVLHPEELRATLARPKAIAQGVAAQYVIMPSLGFAAATFSGLSPALALGFIIVACAPGAMASNVIVYLAGGAVAYSIALTTVATALSPLVTPALVKWLGSAYVDIPFWPMMQTILLTTIVPLLLGLAARRWLRQRPSALQFAEQLAPAVASLAIVLICSYAVAANNARLASIGATLLAVVVIVNALGYLLGWLAARLYGLDSHHQLTLAIEVGMQNAGLGVVLALKHFEPESALPGALFAVWCILTSAGAAAYLRRGTGREVVVGA